jgi:hypothetical protein
MAGLNRKYPAGDHNLGASAGHEINIVGFLVHLDAGEHLTASPPLQRKTPAPKGGSKINHTHIVPFMPINRGPGYCQFSNQTIQ